MISKAGNSTNLLLLLIPYVVLRLTNQRQRGVDFGLPQENVLCARTENLCVGSCGKM